MTPPVLSITRTFDTPRETVFSARTTADSVKQRRSPKWFTCPAANIELRVGGTCHTCMRSPEGKEFRSIGTYQEIVRPEHIVITDSFADENGNIVPASHYGMASDYPFELLVKVNFKEQGWKTTMTLEHIGLPESQMEPCKEGWNQLFDKLEAYFQKTT